MPLTRLQQIVMAVQPLAADDWEAFAAIWSPFAARRKALLTIPGEREKYLYFVTGGVQRVCYFDDAGREATLVFTFAPSFGGVLDSFLQQQPARYAYETLTASTFLRAPFHELDALMATRPALDAFVRKGLTASFAGILERLVEVQCFSAEDRFRTLLRRSPHLLQLVPHKYLASYLGIDATHFSKLLNRVPL